MIEQITIENFKSLKAVTVRLQQVNLLIGPNNSGKSNFLKGIVFFENEVSTNTFKKSDVFYSNSFRKTFSSYSFEVKTYLGKGSFLAEDSLGHVEVSESFNDHGMNQELRNNSSYQTFKYDLKSRLSQIKVYSPNPLTYTKPNAIIRTTSIAADCSNLISFLETLRDEHRESFYAIEEDLRKCIPEFKDIRFQTVDSPKDDKRTYKRWGLFSKSSEIIHWADELSEGVLYFVALLCIVHQPEPPKLLLLEEPERGIHPRRIKEVMDFIFQLSEEKDVQIIMTSHNEHVLKEFAETPESVFIFDKDEEGATQVKNLLTDVIEPSNEYSKEHELEKIDFTSNIGENWFEGLMGGVPV